MSALYPHKKMPHHDDSNHDEAFFLYYFWPGAFTPAGIGH